MRASFVALSNQFLDGKLDHSLRYLPPHERADLRRLACEDHEDARGHEPTITLSVRIPLSCMVCAYLHPILKFLA